MHTRIRVRYFTYVCEYWNKPISGHKFVIFFYVPPVFRRGSRFLGDRRRLLRIACEKNHGSTFFRFQGRPRCLLIFHFFNRCSCVGVDMGYRRVPYPQLVWVFSLPRADWCVSWRTPDQIRNLYLHECLNCIYSYFLCINSSYPLRLRSQKYTIVTCLKARNDLNENNEIVIYFLSNSFHLIFFCAIMLTYLETLFSRFLISDLIQYEYIIACWKSGEFSVECWWNFKLWEFCKKIATFPTPETLYDLKAHKPFILV